MKIEEAYEIVGELTMRQVEAIGRVTTEHPSHDIFTVFAEIMKHGIKIFDPHTAKPGSRA